MIRFTRLHGYLAGGVLIVLANAVALTGVAYNRSGEPRSVLVLSERELTPYFDRHLEGDGEGLTLSLDWRTLSRRQPERSPPPVAHSGGGSPPWFDRAKLAAFGFDLTRTADGEADRRHIRRQRPRQALLVLELEGAAYRQALRRTEEWLAAQRALLARNDTEEFRKRVTRAEEELQRELHQSSRLFVVDAGRDRAALRAAYPDRRRYAIVRGEVRPWLIGERDATRVVGRVSGLAIDEINLPHALQPRLAPLRDADWSNWREAGPPFQVTVAFGRRLEPWITAASVGPPSP